MAHCEAADTTSTSISTIPQADARQSKNNDAEGEVESLSNETADSGQMTEPNEPADTKEFNPPGGNGGATEDETAADPKKLLLKDDSIWEGTKDDALRSSFKQLYKCLQDIGFEAENATDNSESSGAETSQNGPVKQLINIVVRKVPHLAAGGTDAAGVYVELKKEALEKMKNYKCEDRLLIYCDIISEDEAVDEDKLPNFQIKKYAELLAEFSPFIIYIVGTPSELNKKIEKINEYFQKASESYYVINQKELAEMCKNSYIQTYHAGKKEFILQENSVRLSLEAVEEGFTYRNQHSKKQPLAFVLRYGLAELNEEFDSLAKTFSYIGYKVETPFLVENVDFPAPEPIKDFASSKNHGDSCIVSILVDKDTPLPGIVLKAVATGSKLKGKPRLVIIHEVVKEDGLSQVSAEGEKPDNETKMSEDTIAICRYFYGAEGKVNDIKHDQSGLITVNAISKNTSDAGKFMKTLQETLTENARKMDVVSMVVELNRRLKEKQLDQAQLTMQTLKKFYLTDTGDKVSQKDLVDDDEDSDRRATKQVAAVLTDQMLDGARNYQMLLEYLGFEVHAETINDSDRLNEEIKEFADYIKNNKFSTSVILIVWSKQSSIGLTEVVKKLTLERDMLLLLCEIEDSTKEALPELQNRPDKMRVDFKRGSRKEVNVFLNSLLKDFRDYWLLKTRHPEQRESDSSTVKINNPDLFWEENIETSKKTNTKGEGACRISRDQKFLPDLPQIRQKDPSKVSAEKEPDCFWPESKEAFGSHSPRALIIHNVVFAKSDRNRYGSLLDCQRLTDTLSSLGFRVSARANLGKQQFSDAIEKFIKDELPRVLVIMSHGSNSRVIFSDNTTVDEKDIIKKVDTRKTKANPFLLLFQCCREVNESDISVLSVSMKNQPILVGHSTSPKYISYQNQQRGSRFIASLCYALEKYGRKEDLLEIASRVNSFVCHAFPIDKSTRSVSKSPQQPWWFAHKISEPFKIYEEQQSSTKDSEGTSTQGTQPKEDGQNEE